MRVPKEVKTIVGPLVAQRDALVRKVAALDKAIEALSGEDTPKRKRRKRRNAKGRKRSSRVRAVRRPARKSKPPKPEASQEPKAETAS